MNAPVRLEKLVTSKDGSGNNISTVTAKLNTFADVKALSGSRASVNGVAYLDGVFEFRIRFVPGVEINSNWRIIYDRMNFTIHDVQKEGEKNFFWVIKGKSQS